MQKLKNTINPKSPVSIPAQLRELIMEDIAAQVYKPGERFESERGLAERFGVSRASVRETIVADPAVKWKPQQIVILISAEILHFTTGYGQVLRGAESACTKSGDTLILRV